MNPVLRWLDDPPKLFGFTAVQWALIVFGGGGLAGVLHLTGVSLTPAACLLVIVVGTPTAFVRLSDEGAGINVTGLLRDAVRWRSHPHCYDPNGAQPRSGVVVATAETTRLRPRLRRGQRATDRVEGEL